MTEENKKILNDDPRQAVEEMIVITEELVARLEIETHALSTNDGTTFSTNEEGKEHVAAIYEKAAGEFHKRIHEFKQVDKALVAKLDAAQASLGQTSKNNLKLLEKLEEAQKSETEQKAEDE